jgi:hypothetical protein
MNTPLTPDHNGLGRPPHGGGGNRPGVARPRPLPGPAVLALGTADSAVVDGEAATALLERVIQRIFTARLLLDTEPGESSAVPGAQPALDQLDGALSDIRATVQAGTTRSKDDDDHHTTDELGTAIAHLRVAAAILNQLTASAGADGDAMRWAATNDADHTVHRALIILQDTSGGRANLAKIR